MILIRFLQGCFPESFYQVTGVNKQPGAVVKSPEWVLLFLLTDVFNLGAAGVLYQADLLEVFRKRFDLWRQRAGIILASFAFICVLALTRSLALALDVVGVGVIVAVLSTLGPLVLGTP